MVFERLRRLDAVLFRTRQQWFDRVGEVFKRQQLDDALWDEIEEILIQADVGVETTLKLIDNCKARIRAERITEPADAQVIFQEEIEKLLTAPPGAPDPPGLDADPKRTGEPDVILMVCVNGVCKRTTIASLAQQYRRKGQRVVLAAGDAFQAAAIEQVLIWADRTRAEIIARQPGSDA